jgi:hypothetical protein
MMNAEAEGSRSLGAVMRDPGRTPDVVVLDQDVTIEKEEEVLDPTKDLWLSTVDG